MLKKLKKDRRGFTLVELIVTILIMSIVMAAAAGFVITAANSYRVANIEIRLQTEAQTAMNQFNDILIEANSYSVVKNADGTAAELTVATAERMYYFKADAGKNTLMFKSEGLDGSDAGAEYALLAQYCESFEVAPESLSADAGEGRIVTVTIRFKYSGRSYATTSCISLRNQ